MDYNIKRGVCYNAPWGLLAERSFGFKGRIRVPAELLVKRSSGLFEVDVFWVVDGDVLNGRQRTSSGAKASYSSADGELRDGLSAQRM